jgi:HSP20 family protein
MTNELRSWDPFRDFEDMTDRMNRLMGRSLMGALPASWTNLPATDVYEEGGKLHIETALPTFKEDEVDVQINRGQLEIKAEHKAEDENSGRNYLRRESQQSSYYRQFTLPEDVDADTGNAAFENGVLKVTFDRKELPQPKKLALKSGKNDK